MQLPDHDCHSPIARNGKMGFGHGVTCYSARNWWKWRLRNLMMLPKRRCSSARSLVWLWLKLRLGGGSCPAPFGRFLNFRLLPRGTPVPLFFVRCDPTELLLSMRCESTHGVAALVAPVDESFECSGEGLNMGMKWMDSKVKSTGRTDRQATETVTSSEIQCWIFRGFDSCQTNLEHGAQKKSALPDSIHRSSL